MRHGNLFSSSWMLFGLAHSLCNVITHCGGQLCTIQFTSQEYCGVLWGPTHINGNWICRAVNWSCDGRKQKLDCNQVWKQNTQRRTWKKGLYSVRFFSLTPYYWYPVAATHQSGDAANTWSVLYCWDRYLKDGKRLWREEIECEKKGGQGARKKEERPGNKR